MCAWSYVVHPSQEAKPPTSQIQHSSIIDPALQLTDRFVPPINSYLPLLNSTLYLFYSLHSPFYIFHISPLSPPTGPPHPPSHAATSHLKVSGVTPTKVIRKQKLTDKSILYQQATRGFSLYDLYSEDPKASISFSGPLPKLCC